MGETGLKLADGGDAALQPGLLQALKGLLDLIRTTSSVDEIMPEISRGVCALFGADRFTLYVVDEDHSSLISKVKVGANAFKDLKLPISEQSVAGFVALNKQMLNIHDIYDLRELASHSTNLRFMQEVDKRTGYRTKQMLLAPVLDTTNNDELLGVVQIINSRNDQPFSKALEGGMVQLADALSSALRLREAVKTKYDFLVCDGVLSAAEFALVCRTARRKGVGIEDVLLDQFQIKPQVLGQALSRFFGVPYEPFKPDRIRPADLLKNLKREYLGSNHWLPLDETPEGMVVLTTDPERTRASRVVNNIFPKHPLIYKVCSQREFDATLDQYFGKLGDEAGHGLESVDDLLTSLGGDEEEIAGGITAEDVSAAADNELVKLVNKIVVDAYKMGASDIHIEPAPGKDKTLIRFRKDGSLLPYIEIPSSYRSAVVTRIKIMCDLDISEKRRPQDGKIKFKKFGPLDIELRVATLPTQGGVEDVVMRILASGEPIPMDKLGLSERNLSTLKGIVTKPYGLFFVCGPTGSGKTTTLHSVLGYINKPETKIWTAEDPVEITQKGLRQVQINKKAGLDFATIMKAFLRADPDVIMVGEMRDRETVSIGIEASLTGHLVFATLHTNSAPESIIRLLDMGMDPFNFADALLGILAQRLCKRLCKECKKPYEPDEAEIQSLLTEFVDELKHTDKWQRDPEGARQELYADWKKRFGGEGGKFTLYKPVGCDNCAGTGYRGRVGLHELLVGTDAIKKNIQEHARVAEMLVTALNEGMSTLKQDGIEKVLQGITDIHQVRIVCIK
ncbi:MAG: ATPase, T2SS/T4P/T4SS family [Pseudomonadota bacterium]